MLRRHIPFLAGGLPSTTHHTTIIRIHLLRWIGCLYLSSLLGLGLPLSQCLVRSFPMASCVDHSHQFLHIYLVYRVRSCTHWVFHQPRTLYYSIRSSCKCWPCLLHSTLHSLLGKNSASDPHTAPAISAVYTPRNKSHSRIRSPPTRIIDSHRFQGRGQKATIRSA